ncbi:PAC2 domain-containing protein [Rhizoctonia solani AG-1 IA]|uniref:Proteasome assembly chaperone 2 n=1 Tax=Thanatephorus cucumeris (strain AG1-IA) TaxID=983506 RepID=L8WL71_THACA|nr:PAC2 domain-containing protein [Rhizoctonia solani AG-1 IA]
MTVVVAVWESTSRDDNRRHSNKITNRRSTVPQMRMLSAISYFVVVAGGKRPWGQTNEHSHPLGATKRQPFTQASCTTIMSDRPFFRLSAAGPGLPAGESNPFLLLQPVVSAGNVPQLCADLLIHTLGLRHIGLFDPSYYAPAVGGKDGKNSPAISSPMELFGLPGGDIFVLHQRSPVLKAQTNQLGRTPKWGWFSSITVYADLTSNYPRSNHYVILAKDTTQELITSTSLTGLLELPLLGRPLADQDNLENSVIPGTGLARRLLRAPGTTPRIALMQYVAEGDNIPDAHAMATVVAKALKIQIEGWIQPPSWSFAMYGTPHDQQLFGMLLDCEGTHLRSQSRAQYASRMLDDATGMVLHTTGDITMRDQARAYNCNPPSTYDVCISGIFTTGISTHEEIEGKLLKLYKRHTCALEADIASRKSSFSARSVALKTGITDAMVTLEALRSWYDESRNQWVLATRALDTRIRHHNAFYGGGDAGHIQYLDFLRTLISELEGFMQKCDELGYEASLGASAGISVDDIESWSFAPHLATVAKGIGQMGLEERPNPENPDHVGISEPCNRGPGPMPAQPGSSGQALLTPPPSPTSSKRRKNKKSNTVSSLGVVGCRSASCPDELACKDSQKRNATIQRLCVFLEPESGKSFGASYRAEVFATFFRRVIARSPSLFVRARTWEAETGSVTTEAEPSHTNVTAGIITDFIRSPALTNNELERLVKKLPFVRGESMPAELIRGAVADTFRPRDSGNISHDNCIPLLGGWVYEKAWSLSMPPVAWDALHQLVACAGCALGVSRSFEEAMWVRRCAFVGGRFEEAHRLGVPVPSCLPEGAIPRFPRWQDRCSSPEIVMRILNVWLAADNRKTKRLELRKFTPKRRSEKRLVSFVDALSASPNFIVLAQYNTKPKPIHVHVPSKECDAWVSRVRSGATPVARRSARWTTSTVFRMEIFEYFHKRAPEFKAGLTYLDETDILDIVVMDNTNGDWGPFLQSVGDALLTACGYSSLDCMLAGELATARQSAVRI